MKSSTGGRGKRVFPSFFFRLNRYLCSIFSRCGGRILRGIKNQKGVDLFFPGEAENHVC